MEVSSDGCGVARIIAFFIPPHEVLLCIYASLVYRLRVIFYALFGYVRMLCLYRAVFHWTDLERLYCAAPGSFPSLLLHRQHCLPGGGSSVVVTSLIRHVLTGKPL